MQYSSTMTKGVNTMEPSGGGVSSCELLDLQYFMISGVVNE